MLGSFRHYPLERFLFFDRGPFSYGSKQKREKRGRTRADHGCREGKNREDRDVEEEVEEEELGGETER